MKIILLAGGFGKRLWPLSVKESPKQLLSSLLETSQEKKKLSFLYETLLRFEDRIEDLFISTTKPLEKKIRDHLSGTPFASVPLTVEPCSNNTAMATAFCIKTLLEHFGCSKTDACMLCPTDHYIGDSNAFKKAILQTCILLDEDKIVSIGAKAGSPETCYGYLKANQREDGHYNVERFIEKPSKEKAEKFLEQKNYFWNTGTALFKIETMLEAYAKHMPKMFEWIQLPWEDAIDLFPEMENISIDHAILEKVKNMGMVQLDSSWCDIGSFERIYRSFPKDHNKNVLKGEVTAINTMDSLVIGNDKPIHIIGVQDLIVVEGEEGILIARKSDTDLLKKHLTGKDS